MNELARLQNLWLQFRDERDWKQFHTAHNLAIAVVMETSELLELVCWWEGEGLERQLEAHAQEFQDEVADTCAATLLLLDALRDDLRGQPIMQLMAYNPLSIDDLASALQALSSSRMATASINVRRDAKALAVACALDAAAVLACTTPRSTSARAHEKLDASQINNHLVSLLYALCELCRLRGINLTRAVEHKLAKTREKYPADKVKGRADKYTAYRKV